MSAACAVSKYARASLICGLLVFIFPMIPILGVFTILLPLLAIIFGHIALSKIRQSNNSLRGKGIARTGLGLGYFFVIGGIIALAMVPAFKEFVENAKYTEGISALSSLDTNINVFYTRHNRLPGCGITGTNSYFDPSSNLNARCLTQRLVNSPTDIFGLDENGNPIPEFTNKGPFQIDLGIAYNDYEGKNFVSSCYHYRAIEAGNGTNGYAYVLAGIGDGRIGHVEAGTGYAIFTRFNPAEADKKHQHVTATWSRYHPIGEGNVLVLTDQPSKSWHIPVPTFNMSVEEIRKLGWKVDKRLKIQ